jgi:hypothetical protein
MSEVGDTLTRVDATSDLPATAVIVGVQGERWVIQAQQTFSAPIDVTPDELRTAYGVAGDIANVDEVQAWQRFGQSGALGEAGRKAQERYEAERASDTPELAFRRAAASDG